MLQKEIVQKRNNELINHCVVCRFPLKKKRNYRKKETYCGNGIEG